MKNKYEYEKTMFSHRKGLKKEAHEVLKPTESLSGVIAEFLESLIKKRTKDS